MIILSQYNKFTGYHRLYITNVTISLYLCHKINALVRKKKEIKLLSYMANQ